MNVQDQIGKLESLLDTIRRNAQKPRATQEPAPGSASPETAQGDLSAAAHTDEVPTTPEPMPPPVIEVDLEAAVEVEVLDMSETEIIEVSAEEAGVALVGEEVLEEPVPESAPRPAVQTIEREIEREAPIKTPPPESGRQAVTPVPGSPYADIAEPGVGRATVKSAVVEADLSELEIAESPAALSAEPLEASPPSQRGAALKASAPEPPAARAPQRLEPPPQPASPLTVARPEAPDVAAAEVVPARPARLPQTFLDLLDGSLGLGV